MKGKSWLVSHARSSSGATSGGECQLAVEDSPLGYGGGVLMIIIPAVGVVEVPFGGDGVGTVIMAVGAMAAWQEYGSSHHDK